MENSIDNALRQRRDGREKRAAVWRDWLRIGVSILSLITSVIGLIRR